jgi:hypothetical protein
MTKHTEIPADIREKAERCADAIASELGRLLREGGTAPVTGIIPPFIAESLMQERERLETVRAQAYQVIGLLLENSGEFESNEGIRALDYFSGDDCDEDFLPWPRHPIKTEGAE